LPITLLGEKLWVGHPFSNIDIKTRQIERFPSLRPADNPADKTMGFQPGIFFEQTGDREFVLGDPAALWVIKMKAAAAPAAAPADSPAKRP
jgi:hypothetical protein